MKWFEDIDISLTEKDLEELFLPFDPERSKSLTSKSLKSPKSSAKNNERLLSRICLRLNKKSK
ncbi:MAG: hypothetical protein ACRBF0_16015 [Calditrichia bacterium]